MATLLSLLTGCGKDLRVSDIFDSTTTFAIPVDKSPTNGLTRVEDNYPGLAMIANQVLRTPLTDKFRSKAISREINVQGGYVIDLDEKPLSDELANSKLTKQLVTVMVAVADGQKEVQKLNISGKDFRKFVEAALKDVEDTYASSTSKVKVGKMFGPARALTRQGMLFAYLKAYFNGSFVDRSGNIISKPTITGSGVSNATVAGLLNVFLEAFYDYALSNKSPVLAQKDKVVTYIPMYLADATDPSLFVQKFKQSKVNDWFTYKNNQPTAADFVPIEEVSDDGLITPQKARLIRFISNIAGEKSKALSGIIFRAFGSIDVGLVVFGKFNIGDNEILATLLDTTFEVSSRRLIELAVYQFFEKKVDQMFRDNEMGAILKGFE